MGISREETPNAQPTGTFQAEALGEAETPAVGKEEVGEEEEEKSDFLPLRRFLLGMYDKAEMMSEANRATGEMTTGFTDLDRLTGGLRQGNLIVLAGRPASGKSTFCINLAMRMAKAGVSSVFLTLEAKAAYQALKLMGIGSSTDIHRCMTGQFTEDEWTAMAEGVQHQYEMGVTLNDHSYSSVTEMWEALTHYRTTEEIGAVIIDSLQLIGDPASSPDVWETARALKLMARRLDVPVIVTSHLYPSRTERRADRRPVMGDLSGIEGYADEVFLLHRTGEARKRRGRPDAEAVEVIAAKQAHGPSGVIRLAFTPDIACFEDWD